MSSQADIEAATTASSVCNGVQCVVTQDGHVNVPTYDWAAFLGDSYRVIHIWSQSHGRVAKKGGTDKQTHTHKGNPQFKM